MLPRPIHLLSSHYLLFGNVPVEGLSHTRDWQISLVEDRGTLTSESQELCVFGTSCPFVFSSFLLAGDRFTLIWKMIL